MTIQYLLIRLHGHSLALPVSAVREILEVPNLTPVPLTSDLVLGVMNLRGQVVPVLSAARRFGLPESPRTRESCVIVIESGSDADSTLIGILADAVTAVIDIPEENTEPTPFFGAAISSSFLDGVARHGEQLILLLSLHSSFRPDDLSGLCAAHRNKATNNAESNSGEGT